MTFRPHSQEVIAKAGPRLNVMKALTSTTFSHQKEAPAALYKQFIRPVLEYASPAWCSDLAPTHMAALQRTQNAALRIATGCVRSTPIPHLHAESKVLPLRGAHQHEGGAVLRGGRQRSNTPAPTYTILQSPAAACARPLRRAFRLSIPPSPQPHQVVTLNSWIHQSSVSRYLESAQPNTLLGEPPPPPISEEELLLPRADRVHLARLRCGHHLSIPAYEHRIRPDLDPSCRWCQGVPETVLHLFEECPNLAGHRSAENISSVRALWDSPSSSLSFLRAVGVL